ncbi:response regulator transcription factor [Mitsuaria sp. TWR114]|jgi:DNA-binding NarL/FixJ family response regulator|uniref:response regulator n=1 Tax=unclassified Roseateles TaxID=2626991 RepID=UPI0008F39C08|nr:MULTISPECIES: response regulator transcription factor [unclassified Roseateles]MBB3280817.1 DNA-binding NarL/FixJ family response regulator [Mitsuaria sp. BK037]MBB3292878.1 DNA-binding NarL/FixJ family response regulator [Mitsuaria sp. BK041]MBB3362095.1 DNA-binding NarL/FixJ family response regulator [Mitsuaria sp. BK045]TXD80850.1 response regulator transcription factor [Mitsuaria sp. TWR114]SFR77884.1 two component transcriptional regulator, LuxR family [Mitsuaria sp. PDC51]
MSIAVVIIEDDPAVMKRLVDVISNSSFCEVVGVARNRGEAMAAILANRADLYLIDLGLPDADGVELIQLVRERCPESRSMVLSTFGDSKHVMRSLRAGARGYLLKDEIQPSLVEKLVSAHNGQAPLSPAVAQLVVERISMLENNVRPQVDREKVLRDLGMGEREWEVLRLLIEGLPIVEIGRRLSISHHTVNQHLRSVYRKLGVKSRAMAANAARLHGLIDE